MDINHALQADFFGTDKFMTFEKPALNPSDYAVVWTKDILAADDIITSVNIPHGVVSVGNSAFAGRSDLVSVTATESCKTLETGAFASCGSLTTISFPGVEVIGGGAFSGDSSLTTTKGVFPNVKYIDGGAFSGASHIDRSSGTGELIRYGLLDFDFPEVTKLGGGVTNAGFGCRYINLPKCEDLGDGNFCGAVVAVTLENEDGTRNDLNLPKCKRIGNSCCAGFKCKNIILPVIEEIRSNSFNSSEFEACIMSNPTVVCKIGESFKYTTMNDTHGWFYVPKHLLESYKVNCATFASRFRTIEDYPEIADLL